MKTENAILTCPTHSYNTRKKKLFKKQLLNIDDINSSEDKPMNNKPIKKQATNNNNTISLMNLPKESPYEWSIKDVNNNEYNYDNNNERKPILIKFDVNNNKNNKKVIIEDDVEIFDWSILQQNTNKNSLFTIKVLSDMDDDSDVTILNK